MSLSERDAKRVEPSAETTDRILETVATDLRPVRPRSAAERAGRMILVALASAGIVVASFGAMGWRALDDGPGPLLLVAVLAAVNLLAALCLTPSIRPLGGRLAVVAVTLAMVLGWLAISARTIIGPIGFTVGLPDAMCALRGLAGGLATAAAATYLWRRTDPWSPRVSGAMLGAAAGLSASVALSLSCVAPPHVAHVLVGHWLAVPLLALAGAILAPRWLQP